MLLTFGRIKNPHLLIPYSKPFTSPSDVVTIGIGEKWWTRTRNIFQGELKSCLKICPPSRENIPDCFFLSKCWRNGDQAEGRDVNIGLITNGFYWRKPEDGKEGEKRWKTSNPSSLRPEIVQERQGPVPCYTLIWNQDCPNPPKIELPADFKLEKISSHSNQFPYPQNSSSDQTMRTGLAGTSCHKETCLPILHNPTNDPSARIVPHINMWSSREGIKISQARVGNKVAGRRRQRHIGTERHVKNRWTGKNRKGNDLSGRKACQERHKLRREDPQWESHKPFHNRPLNGWEPF